MINSVRNTLSLGIRVVVFSAIFIGPLCAMTIGQDRGFGEENSGAGIVILTSLQRG